MMNEKIEFYLVELVKACGWPARKFVEGVGQSRTEVKFEVFTRVYDSDGSYEVSNSYVADLGEEYDKLVSLSEARQRSIGDAWGDEYDNYLVEHGRIVTGCEVRLMEDVEVDGETFREGGKTLQVCGPVPPVGYVSRFDYEIEPTDGGYFTEEEYRRDEERKEELTADLEKAAQESGMFEVVRKDYSGDKYFVVSGKKIAVVLPN